MDFDIAKKIGEKAVINGAFDGLCIGSTGDACRIVCQKCNGAYIVTVLTGRRSGEEDNIIAKAKMLDGRDARNFLAEQMVVQGVEMTEPVRIDMYLGEVMKTIAKYAEGKDRRTKMMILQTMADRMDYRCEE